MHSLSEPCKEDSERIGSIGKNDIGNRVKSSSVVGPGQWDAGKPGRVGNVAEQNRSGSNLALIWPRCSIDIGCQ